MVETNRAGGFAFKVAENGRDPCIAPEKRLRSGWLQQVGRTNFLLWQFIFI